MTMRLISSTKLITVVLLTALLGLVTNPVNVLGEPEYRTIAGESGLIIEVPKKTQDISNLGPGDKNNSHLRLTNTNSRPVTVYMRTEIISESTLWGGALPDIFKLIIKDGTREICSGTFRQAHERGNINLGQMASGAQKTLYFDTDLPGRETGNEYQGSSMKVQWVFTTRTGGGGGGGGGGRGGGSGGGGDDDEEIIVEEPDVFVPPEDPVTIDNELPLMPQTGEASPFTFYVVGACAIVLGASLIVSKNKS